jgi:tetratricopeptide (TPR) repeat protein
VKRLSGVVAGKENQAAKLVASGKIREISQNFMIAESYYREALRLDSNELEALARLALVKLKAGEYAEGLTLAHQLQEYDASFSFESITGQTVTAMTVLGDAYRLNGEQTKAKKAYETSIKITNGKDRYAASKVVEALVDEGEIESAAEMLKTVVVPDQQNALAATISLLQNDPNRLPALQGVLSNSMNVFASDIAV